jgi:hypothetical protein
VVFGVDESYMYMLNVAADAREIWGETLLHNYGPLGYLLFPMPVGDNLRIAGILLTCLHIAFLKLLWHAAFSQGYHSWPLATMKIVSMALLAASLPLDARLSIAPVAMLIISKNPSRFWLFLAAFMGMANILFKITPGVLALSAIALFWLVMLARKPALWKQLVILNGAAGAAFLLSWYIYAGNLTSLFHLAKADIEAARGISENTSLGKSLPGLWLFLTTISLAGLLSLQGKTSSRRGWPFLAAGMVYLCVALKQSIVREDHLTLLPTYVAAISGIAVLLSRTSKQYILKLLLTMVAVGCSLKAPHSIFGNKIIFGELPFGYLEHTFRLTSWRNIQTQLIQHEQFKETLRNKSYPSTACRMPPCVDKSYDFYPWAYQCNYHLNLPLSRRPVIQSYMANTPWLAEQNVRFFESSSAPGTIIWNTKEMSTLDDRYLLNEETATLLSVFTRYKLFRITSDMFCLSRLPENQRALTTSKLRTESLRTGSWIDVPDTTAPLVLKAPIRLTLIGSLTRTFLSVPPAYLDYRLENGQVITHRVQMTQTSDGIWITPYIESINQQFTISAIRFRPPLRCYEKEFSGTWIELSRNPWRL